VSPGSYNWRHPGRMSRSEDLIKLEEQRPRWDGRASNPVGGAKRRRVGSTPALLRQSAHCIGSILSAVIGQRPNLLSRTFELRRIKFKPKMNSVPYKNICAVDRV